MDDRHHYCNYSASYDTIKPFIVRPTVNVSHETMLVVYDAFILISSSFRVSGHPCGPDKRLRLMDAKGRAGAYCCSCPLQQFLVPDSSHGFSDVVIMMVIIIIFISVIVVSYRWKRYCTRVLQLTTISSGGFVMGGWSLRTPQDSVIIFDWSILKIKM